MLVKSARIARGAIKSLSEVTVDQIDALILPGKFNAAKNLSDFAFEGPEGGVDNQVKRMLPQGLRS